MTRMFFFSHVAAENTELLVEIWSGWVLKQLNKPASSILSWSDGLNMFKNLGSRWHSWLRKLQYAPFYSRCIFFVWPLVGAFNSYVFSHSWDDDIPSLLEGLHPPSNDSVSCNINLLAGDTRRRSAGYSSNLAFDICCNQISAWIVTLWQTDTAFMT